MRLFGAVVAAVLTATSAIADPDIDRLIDAMGLPQLLRAFSQEGEESGVTLNEGFLNGQGGTVWSETVRELYDPERLDSELRMGIADALDPELARTALMFFDSDQGQRIIKIEVQARAAMIDGDIETMATTAGENADARVMAFLAVRDLIDRNTDTVVQGQIAFFDGIAQTSHAPAPEVDVEGRRPMIAAATEAWLRGYYVLMQSALEEGDLETYTRFWQTNVGRAVDDAVFDVFGRSYTQLSYGLGQAIGRLASPNEL